MNDLTMQVRAAVSRGFSEEALKTLRKQLAGLCGDAQIDFEYHLQDDTSYNLAQFVERQARDTVEAILAGDEAAMRLALSCAPDQYNGRGHEYVVIHGTLFETGALELRKQIVDAHPELLKSERILDLEAQVRSLVRQVNALEQRDESAQQELTHYRRWS